MRIGVLGSGSWGTALAIHLTRCQHDVFIWSAFQEEIDAMKKNGANERYLPGIPLPKTLFPETDLKKVVSESDVLLIVVPSHAFSNVIQELKPYVNANTKIVWATKGFAKEGHMLHEEIEKHLPEISHYAVLSGPSFAKEVAIGLPTMVAVASKDLTYAEEIARLFSNDHFRVYTLTDIIGVQVGGALKNVLAVAVGISDGIGYGANTRCSLITRGLAELTRLGMTLGAKKETMTGLSGMGDLILTCTDDQSRNRRFGLAIGQGKTQEEAMAEIGQVVESVNTVNEVWSLGQKHGVDMPITEQVYRMITEHVDPKEAIKQLFLNPLETEA